MFTLPTQPKPISCIIQDGLHLFKPVFKKLWPIILLGILLGMTIGLIEAIPSLPSAISKIIDIFMRLLNLWLSLFLFHLTNQMIQTPYEGYKKALTVSASQLLPCLGIIIITTMTTLMLLVPVFIIIATLLQTTTHSPSLVLLLPVFLTLMIVLIFLMPFILYSILTALFEKKGTFQAIKLGFQLVWGHWGRTIAVLLSMSIITVAMIIPFFIIFFPIFLILLQDAKVAVESAFIISAILASFAYTPFANAVIVRQYHDLKLRLSLKQQR